MQKIILLLKLFFTFIFFLIAVSSGSQVVSEGGLDNLIMLIISMSVLFPLVRSIFKSSKKAVTIEHHANTSSSNPVETLTQDKKKSNPKINMKTTVILFIILLLAFGFIRTYEEMNSAQKAATSSLVKPTYPEMIEMATGVTEEQAQNIYDILIECEISEFDSIETFDIRDNGLKVYEIEARSRGFMLTIAPDGTVVELYVKMSGTLPELVLDGVVKFKVSDLFISNSERINLQLDTESWLKNLVLRSPSTAKFPYDSYAWNLTKDFDKNYIEVSSYVDAQNAFGATIRENFVVGYQLHGALSDRDYSLVYIRFGGEVLLDER